MWLALVQGWHTLPQVRVYRHWEVMTLKAPGKRGEALQAVTPPPRIPAWKSPEFAELPTVGLYPPLRPLCLAQGGPKQVFTGVKESHPRMAIQMETGRVTARQRVSCWPAPTGLLRSIHSIIPVLLQSDARSPSWEKPGQAGLAVTLPSPGSEPCPRAPPMGRRQPSEGSSKPSCLLDERHLGPASPSSTQAGNTIRR